MDKAPVSTFGKMISLIGSKNISGNGFEFSGITFDGNSGSQTVPLGKGYFNLIGFSGASDISIHDINLHDSNGDMARLTNVKNVRYYNNKVIRCGHDGFYVDKGTNIEAWNNYTELRTNSALRLRHVQNGHLWDNEIVNLIGSGASCPGIQIEVSTEGMKSSNILIEKNKLSKTFGPGIWVICRKSKDVSAATSLTIKNNLFIDCGNMDSSKYHKLPGVGGIACDGWNNVDISYNTFDQCKGYGVLFGKYIDVTPAAKGYSAKVRRNSYRSHQ
jgi:hypothetical protein